MTTRIMSAVRSTENATERAFRQLLFDLGYRFRKYSSSLPGTPDIAFPSERLAIFVDGDYWHARRLRERGTTALKKWLKTPNQSYWLKKFERRVKRDREVNAALRRAGWAVLRFWESDLKKNPAPALRAVSRAIEKRRSSTPLTNRSAMANGRRGNVRNRVLRRR